MLAYLADQDRQGHGSATAPATLFGENDMISHVPTTNANTAHSYFFRI